VIIPVYNMGDTLEATLASVEQSRYPARTVIVVDDGSDDGSTPAAIERLAGRFDMRLRIDHAGKSAAANAGARAGGGEVLLFLDADSQVVPDFIERALCELTPEVGAIDFVQRVANPDDSFWTRQAAFERAILALRPDNFGALFAMRREVFEAHPFVDGLSPQYEMNTRLDAEGLLAISPSALVFSEEPRRLGRVFRRKRRWAYGFLEALDRHGKPLDFHVYVPLVDLFFFALLLASPAQPALAVFAAALYVNWTFKAMVLARRLGLPRRDVPGYGAYMAVVNAAVAAGLLAFLRRRRVPWR
jgi:glycosyltransferase involved in cell wall biosynthesis